MAALTTSGTGDWSGTTPGSPWTALTGSGTGGVPGSGDTVTISNAITINSSQTVGASSAAGGTPAISLSGGGSISHTAGTLTVQGEVLFNTSAAFTGSPSTVWSASAGTTLHFVVPASQAYQISFNAGFDGFNFNGTSGSHCIVSATLGSGGSIVMNVGVGSSAKPQGIALANYVDFSNFGNSTTFGIVTQKSWSSNWNPSITNCTFTACSYEFFGGSGAAQAGTMTFTGNTFASSVNVTASLTALLFAPGSSDTTAFTLTGNVFDFGPNIEQNGTWTIQYNVVDHVATPIVFQLNNKVATLDSNLFCLVGDSGGGTSIAGDMTNNYWFLNDATIAHTHGPGAAFASGISSANWTGNIWDGSLTTDATSDFMFFSDSGSACTLTVKGNIVLPNAGGTSSGIGITSQVNVANLAVVLEHNTFQVDGAYGLQIGHLQTVVHAGEWASVKANLFYGSATSGYAVHNTDPSTDLVDIITPTNADYNGKFDVLLTDSGQSLFLNQGRSYASHWSVTPGVHDVTGNPTFVDGTRNLTTWGATQGQGSTALTIALIKTNPAMYIPLLLAYVRAGFRPTNTAFQAASYPGDSSSTDAAGNSWPGAGPGIGAMAVFVPASFGGASGMSFGGGPGSGGVTYSRNPHRQTGPLSV